MNSNEEIEKFMQDFFNQQKEASNLVDLRLEKAYREKEKSVSQEIKDKTRYFKEILLNNDFFEALHYVENRLWKWKYYKQTSTDVAFIVNLEAYEDYIEIYYGYASTAFTKMAGSTDTLKKLGVSSEDINVRSMIKYKLNDNEEFIFSKIRDFYSKYFNLSKDEILSLKKDRQKIFIGKINDRLKSLGFKKKNNTWTKALDQNLCLEFNAQKSQFSDEYYFNVSLYNLAVKYPTCFDTRLTLNDKQIFDWQILSEEELNEILDILINRYLLLIINTPLNQLSKVKSDYFKLECNKKACKECSFK